MIFLSRINDELMLLKSMFYKKPIGDFVPIYGIFTVTVTVFANSVTREYLDLPKFVVVWVVK